MLCSEDSARDELGGISRSGLKRLAERGEVQAVRVGLRRVMYTRESIVNLITRGKARQEEKRATTVLAGDRIRNGSE